MSSSVLFQCLDALFTRPKETLLTPKKIAGDRLYQFQVSEQFLPEKYHKYGKELLDHYNQKLPNAVVIKIEDCKTVPNLEFTKPILLDEIFSIYIPLHRKIAVRLIEIFIACSSTEDFISTICYVHERVNPYLFNWALTIAVINRKDTAGYGFPVIPAVFPEKFFDGKLHKDARDAVSVVPQEDRIPIEIPQNYTASLFETEQRCAYFREDIGLSFYYCTFHYGLPFAGPFSVVAKKRRGEVFYFVHQQILARYNFERLCNGLHRCKRLNNFDKPMTEAYFPKLNTTVASRNYPGRYSDSYLDDLDREDDILECDLSALSRWRDRILEACDQGFAITHDHTKIDLNNELGIDCIGNMIQSSLLSPNQDYYGDLANMGQLFIGFCHDPDGRNLEGFGVIADPATCCRDPMFYRWYALIVDICNHHKNYLKPYTHAQLCYPGIKITYAETLIMSEYRPPVKNELQTYWEKSDYDISGGLDFSPQEPVYVRITNLQHKSFNYKIDVENSGADCIGYVMIYLAPTYDDHHTKFMFEDQRNFFIAMDYFKVALRPGKNTIVRRSTENAIGDYMKHIMTNTFSQGNSGANFTGQGWPKNLMVPKGDTAGFECDLFVMVTKEEYQRDNMGVNLGFPFDRRAPSNVMYLKDFLFENMYVQKIKIRFLDQTLDKTGGTLSKPFQN
ncbi:hypothetical protein DMENIID0001_062330 [Sergentomyia squamirostris]